MSIQMHLWFEIQNVPDEKKESIYDTVLLFFKEKNILTDLTIEWQGKHKNMLVAFETYPVIFSGSGYGVSALEKEWIQLARHVLGESCHAFFTHSIAN